TTRRLRGWETWRSLIAKILTLRPLLRARRPARYYTSVLQVYYTDHGRLPPSASEDPLDRDRRHPACRGRRSLLGRARLRGARPRGGLHRRGRAAGLRLQAEDAARELSGPGPVRHSNAGRGAAGDGP